ncbi:hypothetical protein [Lacrimispora amygdalina]|uniref:hypothetical protein n=1 Tax=Lacrimispora amygdalina TaxID=253257 RepID=UPI000BE3491C|nr:hypothetical protein [Lacrimispora amygdalina]
MGYMTIISILNDAWETIKQHPEEFIDNIEKGMEYYRGKTVKSYPVGNHCNPMVVHQSEHADTPQLLLAHCNSMIDLNAVRENKDSLFHLKYHMKSLGLAKNLIKCAEENIYDVVGKRIVHSLQEDKGANKMTLEEIIPYCEADEWRKELKIQSKVLAKYIKKNYIYIKAV